MAILKNTTIFDTGSIALPVGTTAQRPGSPAAGQIRYNITINDTEYYDGAAWRPISDSNPEAAGGTIVDTDIGGVPYRIHLFTNTGNSTFTVARGGEVEYLIVAGGGSGASRHAGGGGGGGLLTGAFTITPQTYTFTVGAGGVAVFTNGQAITYQGVNGENSSAFGLTAIGGGGGGRQGGANGNAGGSGGGGGENVNGLGGAGTVGQGFPGGNGNVNNTWAGAGGGGGAGSPGQNAQVRAIIAGGNGGIGLNLLITGNSDFYAGGGGGAAYGNSASLDPTVKNHGAGGLGGGGAGGTANGFPGTANTGGGGGGGSSNGDATGRGGNGGSGIVIIRYRRNASTTTQPDQTRPSFLPFFYNSDVRTIIARTGLVLDLDAANILSYPNTGTIITDISGSGITGTLAGGVGHISGSLIFDGTDDHISINQVGNTNSFTHEIFLRPTNVAKDQMYIGYSPFAAHYVRIVNSRAFLSVSTTVAQRVLHHVTTLVNNQVYHIVSVYNGVQLKIYVNNVLTVGPVLNERLNGWGIDRIGRWLDGDQRSFVGDIFSLRSYNRELSSQEIQQNFSALRGRYGI